MNKHSSYQELNVSAKQYVDLGHQVGQLKEEILLLRVENEAVHEQMGQQEAEFNKAKVSLRGFRDERDRLRRKVGFIRI